MMQIMVINIATIAQPIPETSDVLFCESCFLGAPFFTKDMMEKRDPITDKPHRTKLITVARVNARPAFVSASQLFMIFEPIPPTNPSPTAKQERSNPTAPQMRPFVHLICVLLLGDCCWLTLESMVAWIPCSSKSTLIGHHTK